jgi:cytochrome b6-f complex iron-sulfur subunit
LKDVNENRRFLLKNVIKFLPLVGVGAFTYPLIKFTTFQEIEQVTHVVALKEIDKKVVKIGKVFICKEQEGIKVFDAHCTHMGCVLNFDETKQRFICPCHSSEFALDGTRIKGPAKRDLDIIKSKIENNILHIG